MDFIFKVHPPTGPPERLRPGMGSKIIVERPGTGTRPVAVFSHRLWNGQRAQGRAVRSIRAMSQNRHSFLTLLRAPVVDAFGAERLFASMASCEERLCGGQSAL
ncbi:MAG: hypothetical protein IM664_00415 [Phenylobacterium sp.]|uniref:hypothetical protein n=1 Tax=Phenylobacterium sp. TaxID=1871053 RepID=UPI0025F7F690|nr:hypothetical protein [Phenylobacterium sp.]MCA3723506.1 hypothetical protein [Phenylobacterium sp.]MCA6232272.1 hypothetical protein [Phenylobacterium sp.]MCA6236117.1 hypothetical protein [Phenylobacterium sp.]MCA6249396.1 hypothetical protein [Phenylobacterium sp.]MCA6254424.1 hypothetical protein [Phenylobacterium sp.]